MTVRVVTAVANVGLTDIELRDPVESSLPPSLFYRGARQDVLITAITAHRTFTGHLDVIERLLAEGVVVRVAILEPGSDALSRVQKKEKPNLRNEAFSVLGIIRKTELCDRTGFHLRFLRELPPFTAVMVDGDAEPVGSAPKDESGRLRIQPGLASVPQSQGLILQFAKLPVEPTGSAYASGFDLFADDLRCQWRDLTEDARDRL